MPKLYNEPEAPDKMNVNQLKKEFARLSKNKMHDSTHEKFRELSFVINHNTANTFCRDLGHVRLSVEGNASQIPTFHQTRPSDLPSPCLNSNPNSIESSLFEYLCGRGSSSTDTLSSLATNRSFMSTLSCSSANGTVFPRTRISINRKTISTRRVKISGRPNMSL